MTLRSACLAALILSKIIDPLPAARASGADNAALQHYRSVLRAMSAQLTARAALLRHDPKAKPLVRSLHVPPAPLGQRPVFSPSLDDWLQSNLNSLSKLRGNRERAARLAALATSLKVLAAEAAVSQPPPFDARGQARAILRQVQYTHTGAGPAPQPREPLWARIIDWFARLFADLFRRVYEGAASLPLVGQILAVVLLGALAAAVVLVAYWLLSRMNKRRTRPATALGQLLPAPADPEALYSRGLAAAGAGRNAEAIALLFQASLIYLDSAGKVAYDASRTAGEYRRLVRRTVAPASPHFDALAQMFTIAAYAGRAASPHDWSHAQTAFLAMRPLVVV